MNCNDDSHIENYKFIEADLAVISDMLIGGYNKARDRNCRPSHPVDNIRHRHQCSYFIIVYVLMSSFRNSLSQFQNSFHIFFSFHFEFIWIIEAEQKTKFVENEIFQMMNAGPIKMQIMFYN